LSSVDGYKIQSQTFSNDVSECSLVLAGLHSICSYY